MKKQTCYVFLATALSIVPVESLSAQTYQKLEDGGRLVGGGKQAQSEMPAAPRISSKLASAVANGESVPVIVVYRRQPQQEILERVDASVALHRELAEGEFNRMSRSSWRSGNGLVDARAKLDQVVIGSRLAAKREIESEIGAFQSLKAARLEAAGAARVRRFWSHNMIAAEVSASALEQLAADEDVAEVFAVPVMHLSANVTNESIDPNVGVLGLASWWNAGFKGSGQPVAVLDTGINASHPVFSGKDIVAKSFVDKIRSNRCFADEPDNPADLHGHGTHVAGIVAGAGESFLASFQGTAPEVGKIFALKVGANMSGKGDCPDNAMSGEDILSALEWALENTSAKIMNMSFGGETDEDDPAFARIIDYVADTFGLTVVVAAGNSGLLGRPAIGDTALNFNGITVANWDTRGTLNKQDDRVSPSSSRGPTPNGRFKPDVAAPGTQIISASNQGNGFVRMTGTSMAAPKITGVVAVLQQAGIKSPALIKALLINSTDQVGWKDDRGWGFVNMQNAQAPSTLVNGDVGPANTGGYTLFRGRNSGDFYATLAWNRHPSTTGVAFNDLDLFVYDAAGKQAASSESNEQNVEQVALKTDGEVIVKVKALNPTFAGGISREKFGLAISQSEFVKVSGPVLETKCTADSSAVSPGAVFTLTCTVTNKGDMAAQEAKVDLNWSGATGGPSAAFNTLAMGQTQTRSYRVTSPSRAGSFGLQFNATGTAAGETIKGNALFQFTVR